MIGLPMASTADRCRAAGGEHAGNLAAGVPHRELDVLPAPETAVVGR
jgi:hypothetical protein